ncbi:hypothetical protein J4760_10875 [Salinicoccus sp. ID82-1]|nr:MULTISPECIES: TIGR04104 family putative zinc finger protein [Salinicoccus]MCG1010522.1 hypothetical protein [Salinicoccus sp. ID82-1]
MTRCQKCGKQWTFKEKLRKSFKFSFDRSMNCPHCQEKQYLTNGYRKKSALITFLMILTIFLPSFLGASWEIYVVCLVAAVSIGFFLQIHTFELSNTDEGDFWNE